MRNDVLFFRNINDKGELTRTFKTGPGLLYSRKWETGGPIIERETISTTIDDSGVWLAFNQYNYAGEKRLMHAGPTPLIAAMRCYVASKLGDEVDVPNF